MVSPPRLPYPRERRPQVAYPFKETRNDLLRSGAFPPLVSFFLLLQDKVCTQITVYATFWIFHNCHDEGEWEYGADLGAIVILLNLLLKGTLYLFTRQQADGISPRWMYLLFLLFKEITSSFTVTDTVCILKRY